MKEIMKECLFQFGTGIEREGRGIRFLREFGTGIEREGRGMREGSFFLEPNNVGFWMSDMTPYQTRISIVFVGQDLCTTLRWILLTTFEWWMMH
jgi:hypothetical protein